MFFLVDLCTFLLYNLASRNIRRYNKISSIYIDRKDDMDISKFLTDDAILSETGKRIARYRIEHQLTQAELADQAGVSKRTVERLEAGESVQMSTFIRILRILGLLPGLDRLIPFPGPSPMELLKSKGKVRQRVSSKRRPDRSSDTWSWSDDS
jgi:transcriptional regulator with XRE-family HTH domain